MEVSKLTLTKETKKKMEKTPKFEYAVNKAKKTTPVENTTTPQPDTISETNRVVIEFGEIRITMENVGVEYTKEIIKTLK